MMQKAGPKMTEPEGPFLRAAVRLMLLGLSVMVLALMSLYFTPILIAPFLSASLYALLWAKERQHGVSSPITKVMLLFYIVLAIGRIFITDVGWSAYAGTVVYALLGVMVFGLLAAGKPFTMVYSRGAGFAPLHRRMSLMWGSLHLLAALASWFLMPHLAFLLVPMGLMLLGAIGTLVLNFVTMGPSYGRQTRFDLGRFHFAEVKTETERDMFYDIIAEAYRGDLQRAAGPKRRIEKARIEAEHRSSDQKRNGYTVPFLVFDGQTPVGGICMFLDHPKSGLPIEAEAGISANAQRAKGAVVEMGRLGILPRYRLERSVLTGLFKCVIEAAIERRVHTILNDSFTFQVGLYSKIGFSAISDAPYTCPDDGSTGYGLQAWPMALDLARMVRLDQATTTTTEVQNILQPYVVERFFKILAVQEIGETVRESLNRLYLKGTTHVAHR